MTFRIALRSLGARPVRSTVLAGGFGLGIAVMANLLGIGEVILEQAESPQLIGGGDLVVSGFDGRLANARFILANVLGRPPLSDDIVAASPRTEREIYLVRGERTVPIRARGGIPSLERSLDDIETSRIAAWTDTTRDRAWSDPDPALILRAMDRFHAIPDAPRFSGSWAEWHYFNGRAGEIRFYLTFLVGDRTQNGRRVAWVRLQLERDGVRSDWSAQADLDGPALLERAPDLEIAGNSVVLDGLSYRIRLDLASVSASPRSTLTGELVLAATPGRSFPPVTVRGADGWETGYVVPVLSGKLEGVLAIGDTRLRLDDGSGYHDHNWGFWDGVRWQWGQVHGDTLSFVYGRVLPPADVVDRDRLPSLLIALGPEGPLAFSADVTIDEVDAPGGGHPRSIRVRGRGAALDVEMELDVQDVIGTRIDRGPLGSSGIAPLDFLQLRATYRVSGQVDGRAVSFSAPGTAETFRWHGSRR